MFTEFRVIELIDEPRDKEEEMLNAMGQGGWYLISVLPTTSIRRRFYFERLVNEPVA